MKPPFPLFIFLLLFIPYAPAAVTEQPFPPSRSEAKVAPKPGVGGQTTTTARNPITQERTSTTTTRTYRDGSSREVVRNPVTQQPTLIREVKVNKDGSTTTRIRNPITMEILSVETKR